MKKWIGILLMLTLVILAAGVAWTQKQKQPDNGPMEPSISKTTLPRPPAARPVIVEKVSLSRQAPVTLYPGIVHACRSTRLAFRVGGPLVQMNIKPGDRVSKGDLLMQIDPQDYRDRIQVLDAELTGARAQLENARRNFTRMETLFQEKVIPQSDFDQVRTVRDTSRAQVKALQAQLETARHQLSYTRLKAPYDAVVTATWIENHEMVQPGQVTVALHDLSTLEIHINMPENDIADHPLKADAPAMARFPAFERQQFDIRLKEWHTSADPATRTYTVVFTLSRPDTIQLLPGMTAEVEWPGIRSGDKQPVIPAKAVIRDDSSAPCVWRLTAERSSARKVPVTLGPLQGNSRILVTSGLDAGDLIVTSGMDFITEKMMLDPVPADPSPGIDPGMDRQGEKCQ